MYYLDHSDFNNTLTIGLMFYMVVCNHIVYCFNTDRAEHLSSNSQSSKAYLQTENDLTTMVKTRLKLNEDSWNLNGLLHRPATQYSLNLFRNLLDGQDLVKAAGRSWDKSLVSKSDTVRSFSPKDTKIKSLGTKVYKFHIPPLPSHELLRQAEIRLKPGHDLAKKNNQSEYKLTLTLKKRRTLLRKITLRGKPYTDGDYHVYDITNFIRIWIDGFHGDMSLKVRCSSTEKSADDISDTSNQMEKDETILVFFSDDSGVTGSLVKNQASVHSSSMRSPLEILSRNKRSSNKKDTRNRNKLSKKAMRRRKCQSYDYYVDFDLIGWGKWIIHPKQYNAKMCRGTCFSPVADKYTPTNYAILLGLMRQRDRKSPRPCCVPAKLKPQSMLYYENGQIVVRHHEGMIVDECGCR